MNPPFRRLGPSELLPRYIFAESFFVRRRVLEVGAVAATGGSSAAFLLSRGARAVVALDEDVQAIEEASRQHGGPSLRFRPFLLDDLEPASFDLVLVADLAPYVRAPALLAALASRVARGGYLVGGLRNPAGLALAQLMEPEDRQPSPTYGQLLDALSTHFKAVEVATQSPLLGYQLAFERSEGLQVDGTLAGQAEAAYFVVVAGHDSPRQVDPTWVQLPPAPLAYTGGKLEEAHERTRGWEERSRKYRDAFEKVRAELAERTAALERATGELDQSREERARVVARLESLERAPRSESDGDAALSLLRRRETELAHAAGRVRELEGSLATLTAELEQARSAREGAQGQAQAAQDAVLLERARRDELVARLDDAQARIAAASEERSALEALIGQMQARVEGAEQKRLAAIEAGRVADLRIAEAKANELRIAEQHSQALAGIEQLKHDLALSVDQQRAQAQTLVRLEAELLQAQRVAQSGTERVHRAESERDSERRELYAVVERLRGELVAGAGELESERARSAQLGSALAKVEADRDRLKVVLESLEEKASKVHALEVELASTRSGSGRMELELQAADAQLREVVSERDALAERVQVLGAAVEQERRERVGDAAEVEARGLVIARLERELESLRGEAVRTVEALQAELAAAKDAHRQSREEGEAAEQAYRGRVASLEEQAQALEQAAKATGEDSRARLEAERQARTALEEDAARQLRELRERLGEEREARGRAEQLAEERTHALESLERERASLTARQGELEGALAEARRAHEAARATGEGQAQSLAAELERERAERAARQAQLEQALAEVERAHQEAVASGRERAASLADELAKERAERAARQAQLEQALADLERAHRDALAAAGQSEQVLAAERDDLRERLGQLNAQREAEQRRSAEEAAARAEAFDASERDLAAVRAELDAARVAAEEERSALRRAIQDLTDEKASLEAEKDQERVRLRVELEASVAAHGADQARFERERSESARRAEEERVAAEARISELERVVAAFEAKAAEEVSAARASADQQRDKALAELAEVRIQLENALAAEAVAKVRAQDLIEESRLRVAEELERLTHDRDAAQGALETTRHALEELEARHQQAVAHGEEELEEVRQELALAWSTQESRGREFEAETASWKAERSKLEAARAEVVGQLGGMRAELEKSERRVQELTTRLADRDAKLERLQHRMFAQETEISGLRQDRPTVAAAPKPRPVPEPAPAAKPAAKPSAPLAPRRPPPPPAHSGPAALRPPTVPPVKPVTRPADPDRTGSTLPPVPGKKP